LFFTNFSFAAHLRTELFLNKPRHIFNVFVVSQFVADCVVKSRSCSDEPSNILSFYIRMQELDAAAAEAARNVQFPFAAAMMNMFANMAVNSTMPSPDSARTAPNDPLRIVQSRHGSSNGGSETKSHTRSTETDSGGCRDGDGADETRTGETSDLNDRVNSASSFNCTACGSCGRSLETNVAELIDAAERRLASRLLLEVGRIEAKMDRRFDEILQRLNGPRRDVGSYDLD
jgi:hypothetical protein